MKFVVFNHWVDGYHFISLHDTEWDARDACIDFIGHDEYPTGQGYRSDDGDHCHFEKVGPDFTEEMGKAWADKINEFDFG